MHLSRSACLSPAVFWLCVFVVLLVEVSGENFVCRRPYYIETGSTVV